MNDRPSGEEVDRADHIALRDHVPHGRYKTLTFVADLHHDRITAPSLFDGPINVESFRAYIEQILLTRGQPPCHAAGALVASMGRVKDSLYRELCVRPQPLSFSD